MKYLAFKYLVSLLLLSSVFLLGCARHGGELFSTLVDPPESKGRIYLYHPHTQKYGFDDTLFPLATIYVNKSKMFSIYNGTYSQLELSPGTYTFTASTDNRRACHGTWSGSDWPPVTLNVGADKIYFIRYGISEEYQPTTLNTCYFRLWEIDKEAALAGLKTTRYVKASRAD